MADKLDIKKIVSDLAQVPWAENDEEKAKALDLILAISKDESDESKMFVELLASAISDISDEMNGESEESNNEQDTQSVEPPAKEEPKQEEPNPNEPKEEKLNEDKEKELLGGQPGKRNQPSGYSLVSIKGNEAIVKDESGKKEVWVKAPHFAGYALMINGTEFEFTHELKEEKLNEDKENIMKNEKDFYKEMKGIKEEKDEEAVPEEKDEEGKEEKVEGSEDAEKANKAIENKEDLDEIMQQPTHEYGNMEFLKKLPPQTKKNIETSWRKTTNKPISPEQWAAIAEIMKGNKSLVKEMCEAMGEEMPVEELPAEEKPEVEGEKEVEKLDESTFTKSGYEKVIPILAAIEDRMVRNKVVAQFIEMFKGDNPNFDPYKFKGELTAAIEKKDEKPADEEKPVEQSDKEEVAEEKKEKVDKEEEKEEKAEKKEKKDDDEDNEELLKKSNAILGEEDKEEEKEEEKKEKEETEEEKEEKKKKKEDSLDECRKTIVGAAQMFM